MIKIMSLVGVVAFLSNLQAAEYFVDCTRPDDSGDGLSESAAKRTIQAAIEAAEADADTPRIVTVLPGTYAEGGKVTDYECNQDAYKGTTLSCTNRVLIAKGLTLRAKDPTRLTEIVGAWDTSEGAAEASVGIGPKAVRCVLINTSARVILLGLTLRDGAAQDDNTRTSGGYWPTFAGGVAYGQAAYNNYILADCTIRNCSGRRGAACMGGKLIRCRVSEACGPTLSGTVAINSVFYNQRVSRWGQYLLDGGTLCNCTVFKTEGTGERFYFSNGGKICNTLVFGFATYTGSTGAVNATNSVVGCDWNGVGQKDEASVFSAPDAAYYMFKSPLDGDWRLRSDSEYLTLGDAKYIADFDWAADFDPYKDLDGNTIPASGAIAPGCTQSTFTPVCGPIRLNDNRIVVDGTRKAYNGSYFYSDDKFAQYRLTITLASGEYLHSWNALYESWVRFPATDDSLMVMPPPDVDVRSGNKPTVTSQAFWVSPTGDDDAGDGSQGAPFKTLLKAGAAARDLAATSKNKNFVVFAAAGTYDEKTVTTAGGLTRVYDYEQNIRFVGAGAYGEGRSVIAGELDPDVAADADPYGRGPKAVRCARLSAYTSCLQNFEVRDGRCSFVDGDRSDSNRGGGIFNGAMVDCHVVNCGAGRGQAAYQGRLERCRVTYPDPIPGARVMEDGGYAVSCIFEKEVGRGGNNGYTDARPMVQCSLYPDSSCRGINNSAAIYNCLSTAAQSPSSSWNYSVRGMVCPFSIGLPKSGTPVPDYKQANPQFVDYENGDFRLKSTSPAIGYGSLRSQSNPDDDSGYWKTYGPDINGKPILFFDGKPLPGAVQELVQVVEIEASDYADVTPVGTRVVEPGESVTVTLTSPKRPPVGFTVGGEKVAGTTCTYTAPLAGTPTNALVIAPLFGTNWYVNAAMPNDDGDGFTPETAKKTLISLCTNTYVRAGDVIHAAAGDYNEGAACHDPQNLFIRSRAIVKKGVTLVADAGEDEAFITGAPAEGLPGGSIANGCGDTAIRCVTSYGGGILKGFTLRDGYTCAVSGVNNNCLGGGYLGLDATARIEDCTITNCFSHRSALAHGGRYERCNLMGNTSAVGTGFDNNNVGTFGGFYNCRIITSSSWTIVCPFVNCIMRNASSFTSGGYLQIYANNAQLKMLTNCVVACSIRNQGGTADGFYPAISNNIVCTGFGGTTPTAECQAWFKILTEAQIKEAYDYDYLSFTGEKSDLFCDAGANVDSQMDAVDLYGNPRTMNGAIDLGPAEWDWRPTYTRTIAQPGVSVRDAAPMVLKEDEKVRIYDGDLVMNWTASSRKAQIRRRMTFTVTGAGTLTVFADGEELGTYTQAAEPQMIDFKNTLETSVVKFSYAKGTDDTGYVEIGETIGEPGVLLIIR